MLVWLLLLTPFVALILFMELKTWKIRKYLDRINGPTKLPIIGNAHQIGKDASQIFNQLFDWWQQFNYDNFRMWIGYAPFIIISNVKDMEYILTSKDLIQKSDVYDLLHPWLGQGLLTSYGNTWFKHRKMITPSFHFKILQYFHQVMNSNSKKFMQKLLDVSRGESIFDIQEMVHYLTLDVICETAMGVQINAMDCTDSDIVKAVKNICTNINIRAFHPIKRSNRLYRFSADYAEYAKTLHILETFTKDIIQKRIEARQNAVNKTALAETEDEFSSKKQAFLDTLLTSSIDGNALTMQEIYEEVSTFIFEGHDTTTSGIAFAIYLLSRHPEVQHKVFAEQCEILADNLQREATFQEIAEMKYLDLVIKEAQRLYPSVPVIGRFTDKDYNINGTIVPKGVTLSLFLMALGYNDKSFADPYRFDPERFSLERRGRDVNPFEYVPFSAGPRNCIGQKFALLEIKTVVSKIVRTFEILPPVDDLISKDGYVECFPGLTTEQRQKFRSYPSKYVPILSTVLTLKSENGLQIRLKARI